jgi:hypothetical protein
MSKGTFRERKERETNQVMINTNEHSDLFYRGSVLKNLVLIEEATKVGSIPTLSLSQSVIQTGRCFSLITWVTKSPQESPHT